MRVVAAICLGVLFNCVALTASLASADIGATASNQMRPLGQPYPGNGYLEYLPPGYGQTAPSPLLIFLHGSGEGGNGTSDLAKVSKWGPPQLIAGGHWPSDRPFVVLSPQHNGTDCASANEVRAFIQFAVSAYHVDKNRIYLTGLSCGALSISAYLATYGGEQVAAAVPVAGDLSPAWAGQGCKLVRDVALWAFHGGADTDVPIAGDNQALPLFLNCSARKDVGYTIYPHADHPGSWIQTYDLSAGNDIYRWLLSQSR